MPSGRLLRIYYRDLACRAAKESCGWIREKAPARLLMVGAGALAAALLVATGAAKAGRPWWESLLSGLVALAFAAAAVFLWKLVQAPALRDREHQEEVARLLDKLNPAFPDVVIRVAGTPFPFRPSTTYGLRAFLIFDATVTNKSNIAASLDLRLRIKVTKSLYLGLHPEQAPIKTWEKLRSEDPGGMSPYLRLPINLQPSTSQSGYVGFRLPGGALEEAVTRAGIVECILKVEDLTSGKSSEVRSFSLASGYFKGTASVPSSQRSPKSAS